MKLKKDVMIMSVLGFVIGGFMALPFASSAQTPEKELMFAVLNDSAGAKVAEVTVTVSGLHFKVVGYQPLNLGFDDIELLKKAAQVNAQ